MGKGHVVLNLLRKLGVSRGGLRFLVSHFWLPVRLALTGKVPLESEQLGLRLTGISQVFRLNTKVTESSVQTRLLLVRNFNGVKL